MNDLLIKNGLLVTSEKVQRGDLAIQDGKIAAILSSSDPHWAKECIFADNLLVFPGAIDTHAHLNDPGARTFSTARRPPQSAALRPSLTCPCKMNLP